MPPSPPTTTAPGGASGAPGAASGTAGAVASAAGSRADRPQATVLSDLSTLYQGVRSRFPVDSITPVSGDTAGLDQPTWIVEREVLADLARELRDNRETRFDLLMDVAGVDFPDRPERFEAVYHLYSVPRNARLRLKVAVAESDPVLPSLVPVWNAANWAEREVFDMFGLRFTGHPNLSRLLCHEGFQGHALRKDYDSARRWILTEDKIYKPHFDLPAGFLAGQGGQVQAASSTRRGSAAPETPEIPATPETPANPEIVDDDLFERMTINIGPSHPAMHGTFRLMAVLDGETIVASDMEIGYLHRCFEKMCETHTWQQVIPYTDRLNYCSSFINNVAYCRTVERLLGIEAPPRAVWARTILSEFSRIMDHCVCNGTTLVDAGGLTNFWYMFQPREEIYGLLESCCGARLTVSYCRIGGLSQELPPDFMARCRRLLEIIPPFVSDVEKLCDHNRIWLDRAVGVAAISGAEAVNWGWTGPCLRASGVPFDVRRAQPYDLYDTVEWDVPVLYGGDVYDRYRIRNLEIRQSLRIIRQLLDRGMPEGGFIVDDPHVALPPKEKAYNEMEAMIYHFKLIMDGIQVPEGELYLPTEGANGELGFYILSDGTAKPYRIKVRPPCLPMMSTFSKLIRGGSLSDAVVSLGGLNVVAGELER
ncbi:MAG TPA: NADH-quinone oxidoreductase subunit D [Thermoanaerobaculia bacterium]|nr:NADH-quinone oxidoreductase subunit D [Thermoanaerobaculia bacterium]